MTRGESSGNRRRSFERRTRFSSIIDRNRDELDQHRPDGEFIRLRDLGRAGELPADRRAVPAAGTVALDAAGAASGLPCLPVVDRIAVAESEKDAR